MDTINQTGKDWKQQFNTNIKSLFIKKTKKNRIHKDPVLKVWDTSLC